MKFRHYFITFTCTIFYQSNCILHHVITSTNQTITSTSTSTNQPSKFCLEKHWVKSVPIRNYSGPHFPTFGVNTERCSIFLSIRPECGKMWSRITTNMETFQALNFTNNLYLWNDYCDFITLPKVKKESQGWILLKR